MRHDATCNRDVMPENKNKLYCVQSLVSSFVQVSAQGQVICILRLEVSLMFTCPTKHIKM